MSKFKDDELKTLASGAEKEPTNLDDRIIAKMARDLLDAREGIRQIVENDRDITTGTRLALEELLP